MTSLSDAFLARDTGRELRGGGYRKVFKFIGGSWVYKFDREGVPYHMGNSAEWKMYRYLVGKNPPPSPLHLPEVLNLGSNVLAMKFVRGRAGHEGFDICNCYDRLSKCWIGVVESWGEIFDVHGGNVKIDTQGRIWLIDLGELF